MHLLQRFSTHGRMLQRPHATAACNGRMQRTQAREHGRELSCLRGALEAHARMLGLPRGGAMLIQERAALTNLPLTYLLLAYVRTCTPSHSLGRLLAYSSLVHTPSCLRCLRCSDLPNVLE